MENFILSLLKEYWYDFAVSILAAGAIAKYVRLRLVAGEFLNLVHSIIGAKANGEITEAEYADIGKKAVPFAETLWSIIKGLFPNKSKES